MGNLPIDAIFNGAYDLLRACFTASKGLSDASKGAVRVVAEILFSA